MSFSRRAIASFGVALMLAGGTGLAWAGGPSFDCRKAQLPAEKAICADKKMAAIDVLANKAFGSFQPEFSDKRQIARSLIADRNACGADAACIVSAQNNALETYGTVPSWVQNYNIALIGKKALDFAAGTSNPADQPLPSSIGSCSFTHIAMLTARIGDDPLATASPEAGSAASFTNGGTAVSYDREPGLVSASVGDPVVMCLISIPRDCPQGDVRGRVYYAVDLAHKGTWALPDSQHMCGGA
ncbi:lysozyme inhibitor LprI family protein [Mesorhizobium sp.]|uniref:lysozyme inhibitor LprI family protein n=1 Tax=Mesorhizobium sp. TaxID=1871066 RepID=UPI0025E8F237|nr:lysozyme inhibitor LprI family protein [Mesorhizobium sp.]